VSGAPLTTAMDNVLAWRMGEALAKARKHSAGDYIDVGLSLLVELNAAGFDVVCRARATQPLPGKV
jgi:hypothetical protein